MQHITVCVLGANLRPSVCDGDQLELLKEIFRLQNRATQAETNVFNIISFLIALIKRGVVLVNYELLEQFMREVAETKLFLLRSMAQRTNP